MRNTKNITHQVVAHAEPYTDDLFSDLMMANPSFFFLFFCKHGYELKQMDSWKWKHVEGWCLQWEIKKVNKNVKWKEREVRDGPTLSVQSTAMDPLRCYPVSDQWSVTRRRVTPPGLCAADVYSSMNPINVHFQWHPRHE